MGKKSALHINKGTSDAPFINPKWKGSSRFEFDIKSLYSLIIKGDSAGLSKAITLIESLAPKDRVHARNLMSMLLSKSGGAYRIGISGVPGVGKSTFLESFCSYLLAEKVDVKIAILAVVFFAFVYSRSYLRDRNFFRGEYYVLGLFATLGMMIMVSASNLLTIYLGLELLSLSNSIPVILDFDNSSTFSGSYKRHGSSLDKKPPYPWTWTWKVWSTPDPRSP